MTGSRPSRFEVVRAAVLGMSQETRDAWGTLLRRLSEGPVTLLGAPGPGRVLLDRARQAGALEGSLDDFSAPTRRVVIPMTGATPDQRRSWKERGHEVIDLTLPVVRRAHATLGLLKSEGYRPLVVGFRGDPECRAIIGGHRGVAVVASADDILELPYAPRFGVVFQTAVSSVRARAVVESLRGRFRDSRLQVLDTLSPAALLRERALRELGRDTDGLVVLADAEDASGRALYECARWLGKPARLISRAGDLDLRELGGLRRIGLSAGDFTPDDRIEELAVRLGE